MAVSTLTSYLPPSLHEHSLSYLLILFFSYLIIGSIYRLYFHPLAKVPGPKLAALTLWYEFYHDFIRKGKYLWVIGDMHAKYGPIVRISPNEVHILDKDFYDTLYGHSLKLDKDPWAKDHPSGFGTGPSDLHRVRRSALNPFFSPHRINETQDIIVGKLTKLCDLLTQKRGSGVPVNLSNAYRAFTIDVITEYVMTESIGYLDREDLGAPRYRMIRDGSASQIVMNHFGWIMPIMKRLPYKWALWLFPDAEAALGLQRTNEQQILALKTAGPSHPSKTPASTRTRNPMFHDVLFNSNLPAPEKTIERLGAEATLVVIAGSDTVGNSLTKLHYHLLDNPDKLARLKRELSDFGLGEGEERGKGVEGVKWQELKELKYLSACVTEILRLGMTVTHRLARVAGKEGVKYGGFLLPAGTSISMSTYFTHLDPTLFPSPHDFIPERWLEPGSKTLNKYVNAFSKGPRICLGIELAYAELYLAAATIYSGFDTKLYQTARDEVEVAHDFLNGYPRLDAKGVRVTVE
ncbi:MAG: hypothetical protein HETSPECPRED_004387 [Heterodermia speciosa]|uniref:Cytochrome P450 n=1 Tax=Heterodermia speciosa TaxID=116794 RepID=A0A8H3F7S2_9LECA|nr:MAG: hypothetical protein HETSPECPRED_004387 [Heterodermia speciosa]